MEYRGREQPSAASPPPFAPPGDAGRGGGAVRAFEPPLVIDGRYHVSRVIGEGALWRVYDAIDVMTRARVLVKRVRHTGAISVARFVRQVEIETRLVHPNIVPFVGHGETGSDEPYLVYAWIDGPTLAARLREGGPLPWPAATFVAAQVGAALSTAHSLGIIHRDVKPSNIVLDSQSDRPMLIDFDEFGELGIDSSDRFTTVGSAVVGTPAYMAPEQLTGQPQTAATDVYGLGIVLYEMLFGAPPAGGSFTEIVSRVLAGIEIPERADVPESLRQLLGEMLALDATKRPAMKDVAAQALFAALASRQQVTGTAMAGQQLVPTTTGYALGASGPGAPPPKRSRATGASRVVASSRSRTWLLLGLTLAAVMLIAIPGFSRGIGLILLGVPVGMGIARQLARRGEALEMDAARVLLGSNDPGKLPRRIAIEIERLAARSTEIDVHLISATITMMMNEVERAESSADRQTALVRSIKLFEKLREHLSPWYVRYHKQLGAIPVVVSTAVGGVKIWGDVLKLVR